MTYNKICLRFIDQRIAQLTLNDPETLNALDLEMRHELHLAIEQIMQTKTRVLVIRGTGRAFSAGGNIQSMVGISSALSASNRLQHLHQFLLKLRKWSGVSIASVHGATVGAGMNLALACDHIIAATNTKLCQSFSKIGLIPDCGGLWLLPRLVGPMKAKEWMLRGTMVQAEEAYRLGLINELVEPDELEIATMRLAEEYANGPAMAYGYIKRMINESYGYSFAQILEAEAMMQSMCMESDDFREGINAFLEKRKPVFNQT